LILLDYKTIKELEKSQGCNYQNNSTFDESIRKVIEPIGALALEIMEILRIISEICHSKIQSMNAYNFITERHGLELKYELNGVYKPEELVKPMIQLSLF